MEIELPHLTCQRCGNTWIPRTPEPKQCPKCKSPYWNKTRKKQENEPTNLLLKPISRLTTPKINPNPYKQVYDYDNNVIKNEKRKGTHSNVQKRRTERHRIHGTDKH